MSQVLRSGTARLSAVEAGLIAAFVIAVAGILGPVAQRSQGAALPSSAPEVPAAQAAPAAPRWTASAHAIIGRADVRDGDTLRIGEQRIRLAGADAFELHQECGASACGEDARRALQRIIGGRPVACEPQREDRYGRTIADCFVDGRDIGAELVRQGHALAYRRYSSAYVDEEAAARAERRGAWRGSFDNPEDWRRANPRR